VGQNVMGRVVCGVVVHDTSFPWGKLSMGELSLGRAVQRELSMGQNDRVVKCTWGKMTVG
jgi:hypothetical protein